MDRGAWQAMVHRVAKSRIRLERLSTAHSTAMSMGVAGLDERGPEILKPCDAWASAAQGSMVQPRGPSVSPWRYYFSFFLFFAMPCGIQDLSSPTRDRTHAPCSGSTVS